MRTSGQRRAAASRRAPAAPLRRRGRCGGGDRAGRPAAAAGGRGAERRRDPPGREAPARGDPRHQLADARRPGEGVGAATGALPIVPDDPTGSRAAVRAAAAEADLVILVAGSSAGRDDYTARVVERLERLAVHGVAVRPGHPVVLGVVAARR